MKRARILSNRPSDRTALGDDPYIVPVRRGGALRALRHRDYRLFWVGLGLALTGFQIGRVALSFLAYQLTGSALYLTLVFMGDSIPMLLLSPIGGVLVDRVNRKTLLLISRTIIALASVAVSVLIVAGWIEAWHLLAFAVLTGVCYAFDIPARQAAIHDLVPAEDFVNAVALSSTVIQSSRIIGPAIGGLALTAGGPAATMALMAAGSAGQILMVALTRLPHTAVPSNVSPLANLKEGFRFIAARESIWMLMLLAAVPAMFAMNYQSLTAVFAQDVLGRGKAAIGVMLTAAGIGAVAGSIAVATYGDRLRGVRVPAVAAMLFSLLVIAFALSRSYPLSLALLVCVGGAGAVYSVMNSTLVQALTPREMQGRVMGVYQLTWNVQLFGALLIGALADAWGGPAALVLGGTISAVSVLVVMALRHG